jgi:hypothetical protein
VAWERDFWAIHRSEAPGSGAFWRHPTHAPFGGRQMEITVVVLIEYQVDFPDGLDVSHRLDPPKS